jgi:hypothetical protein
MDCLRPPLPLPPYSSASLEPMTAIYGGHYVHKHYIWCIYKLAKSLFRLTFAIYAINLE